jgi:hypothetical protein
VTDYLDDIASDLSAFHRIDDAGEMEAAVFFALAARLPAYRGVMAAVAQREHGQRGRPAPRYDRASAMANNARAAPSAPVATAGSLAALNAQLGGQWFAHRTVSRG